MNKVTISPFLTPTQTYKNTKTPSLLTQHRNQTPHINKLRLPLRQHKESEEPFQFDDEVYFKEYNKCNNNQLQLNHQKQQRKKCFSQIMNVKIMEENNIDFQKQRPRECLLQKEGYRTFGNRGIGNSNETNTFKLPSERSHRNYTSQSKRRNYQVKQQTQRNSYSFNLASAGETESQDLLSHKINKKPKEAAPHRRKSRSNRCTVDNTPDSKTKDKNIVNYSIIKPDEIKSLSLLVRSHQKEHLSNKKDLYFELMQQLKRKEEIQKQRAKVKDQLQLSRKSCQRSQIQTATTNRGLKPFDQSNELEPWQVQTFGNDIY